MRNSFIIREATTEDISAMVKVGDKLFDSKIKPHRAKEFLDDPRHHMLLAYADGKVVGLISGFHYVHPDKDPQLFINEVGVVDEFQNQEIGRDLVKHMSLLGKKIGCTCSWVTTETSNQAAIKSYLAAGGKKDEENIVLIEF